MVLPQPVAPAQATGFSFGVYPGGGTGETPNYVKPSDAAVTRRMVELAAGRPMQAHLYTAWSWHDDTWLDGEIKKQTDAGFGVILTVKYAPPAGHDGDIAGYEAFVRRIVGRYGSRPGLVSFYIGNEANNLHADRNASDGPIPGADAAVARGAIAAKQELARMGSSAQVGFNFVFQNTQDDTAFIGRLVRLGGSDFTNAISVVGVQVYPGIWYPGGPPYDDMVAALTSARTAIDAATSLRGRPIEVLETGAPLLSETEQATRLDALVRATLDNRSRLNIAHFNWFDLWDADTASQNQFAHYGLLRSDLSTKPAFDLYKRFVASL